MNTGSRTVSRKSLDSQFAGRLLPAFFQRPALEVAPDLIGKYLVTTSGDVGQEILTGGYIIEVEAYGGPQDEACHGFRGKTARNEVLFRVGGFCYVYFIYGMYFCVNAVTGEEGSGEGVLIRGIVPQEGTAYMEERRESARSATRRSRADLASGPGKLCRALGIDRFFNGEHYSHSPRIGLYEKQREAKTFPSLAIENSPRIGIKKSLDFPWRFFATPSSIKT